MASAHAEVGKGRAGLIFRATPQGVAAWVAIGARPRSRALLRTAFDLGHVAAHDAALLVPGDGPVFQQQNAVTALQIATAEVLQQVWVELRVADQLRVSA